MGDFLLNLFDTSDFPARWHCGNWTAGHGWLHILSDLGVWSAYVAIPCVLVFFALRKRDLPFRTVFLLFGAFILACGTTHLMEAIIFYWPVYRLAGMIKLFTALVSWCTVFALVPIAPRALAMRSPEELEREIEERKRAERALRQLHEELEQRVNDRTAELAQANQALQTEIAERRKAEEVLREQREWFQVTLSSIGDAVIATDAFGDIRFLNPGAEKLTGWTSAEAVGQGLESVFPIVHEETREPLENPVAQVLRESAVVNLTKHALLVAKDGIERPIADSAAPILGSEGMIHGVVMVFQDVTERRRNERTIRFLVDASEVLNKLVDHQTTLKQLAELAVPFFADSCAVYSRKPDGQFECIAAAPGAADEPLDEHHQAMLAAVLAGSEAVLVPEASSGDAEADSPRSGTQIFVPLAIHERLLGVIGFTRHSPDRQYGQIELDLASEVARRAAIAIENGYLYREVRDADRRKDEFLATLAHELRNPLAPIVNSVALLRVEGAKADSFEWALEIIGRQVEQMARLVDDLLDVSRITRGKVELRSEPVELTEVIKRAVETSRPLIDAHDHTLKISLPQQPIWLDADPVRLAQALANLLNNAAKYTDRGGKVWIDAELEKSGVVVRVRDSGIGIERELLPKVFDLFTQADRSVARSQGGLGIGLTLVRSLVELHGGRVTVDSPGPGHGSEFIIRLPTLSKPSGNGASQWQPGEVAPRRVLVVEDNRSAAQVLSKLLERVWGHDVEMAHDGLAAIEVAKRQRPEIVLLDIGLPGASGYDVARQLREMPEFESILIVALTGYGQEEDRLRSREAGFDEHLVKPPAITVLEGIFRHPKLSSSVVSGQ